MENRKSKVIRGIVSLLFVMTLCFVLPAQTEAAVKINVKSVTLLRGKTYTIQLKGTRKKVAWKTSQVKNVRIIKRSKTAVRIKAMKVGRAVVSTKIGKKTYKCNITVVEPKISKTKLTLKPGNKVSLKLKYGTGRIIWKSSNPTIATVNSKGLVTAKKAGNIKVTATQNKKRLTCTIVVQKKKSKKVWVTTKKAWTEYIPVYDYTYYIECTNCGVLFNSNTELEEYSNHAIEHALEGEPGGSRGKTERKLIETKINKYPEEGYWKTVYYY